MVKIIIPERKVIQTFREFKADEGELILLVNRHRVDEHGLVKSAILGVFGGVIEEDNSDFVNNGTQTDTMIKNISGF